jgi:hypothetical protein
MEGHPHGRAITCGCWTTYDSYSLMAGGSVTVLILQGEFVIQIWLTEGKQAGYVSDKLHRLLCNYKSVNCV